MASVSVRDVAALAGVSMGTVSNVLNHPDKVSSATVARVQSAVEKLGFVPNGVARQLRAGISNSIGLVVLDAANPFFTDLASGAEARAAERHHTVLVGNSSQDPARETAYLDLFEQQRVRGVLLSPVGDVLPRLERLHHRGIPSVLVDRQAGDPGFSSVSVDDVAGGRLATTHLVSLGHRRIVFVGGPFRLRQVSDRLAGARSATKHRPDTSIEFVETESLTVEAGHTAGQEIRARTTNDRPDAVFAANDLVALGLLQAFMHQGSIKVPEEIALIGYDDITFASAAVVPLSSVRQPSHRIGSTSVELLLREADGGKEPRHIVFQPELVVRASTGR
ncbi:LacI family DNA-binding transcriptional regulator [Arthrobacter castelli]|uniref:LacI family DNA-binding transcriptional regulator n=1 Tax=Arthrobacter castelli TaxID=271431 RepID=UPI0003FEA4E4|nr:LacI family DNA-binding transcriptional regulator [Arthrobacter castelli]